MRRRFSATLGALCAVASFSWSIVARADVAHTVAIAADGPSGDALVRGVASRLEAPFVLGDAPAFHAALGPKGMRSLAAVAKGREHAAEMVSKARAAARRVQAGRAILVHTEKTSTRIAVHVWVVDVDDSGGAQIDEEVPLGATATVDDETDAVWSTVAAAFPPAAEAAAPPPPPAPQAAMSPVPEKEPTANEPPAAPSGSLPPDAIPSSAREHTRASAFAVLGVEIQGGSRHFAYVDSLTSTLRPYDLFVAPAVEVKGEIYPFMHTGVPVVSQLGLEGSFSKAFGLSSQDEAGTVNGTSWQAFDLGLRERIPMGPAFIMGIDAGYGETSFEFDDPVTPTEQVPSVDYKFLRAGLDGRFVTGDLSIFASASYLDVLSTGDFGQLFPHASVAGVEASLGASQMVARGLEASFDIEYTRMFYSLLPQPGDTYVAGGALDEMASISLGLSYLF